MRKLFTFFAAILCAANLWATTAYVSTYAELSSAISDAAVENIIVTANIDVPCDTSKNAGNTDLTGASTAQLIINRSLTLQSQAGSKYIIKRVAAGATSNRLKSLIAIRGNGNGTGGTANLAQNTVEVSFTNIIIDGGANWGSSSVNSRRSGAVDAYGYSGRSMIDVYLGGTLNLEDGVELRNGYTTKSDNSLLNDDGTSQNYGGAVRVEYHDQTGGGTVNVKAGAVIHDCATQSGGNQGYGGALGAYNYARLNLYGGTIYNCSSGNGGAIACTYRGSSNPSKQTAGTIRMYGGTISNCYANKGGALSLDGNVESYILGGSITSCTASNTAGAMRVCGSGTRVHVVESSSGWLTIDNCSPNVAGSENTGNYPYITIASSENIISTHVYQVTFMNYSEEFAVLHVLQDNTLGEAFPAAPVNPDAQFLGWFTGNTQVTGSTPITGNMTLTAQWTVASITSGETVTHYDVFSNAVSAWVNNSKLTLLANVETSSTIMVDNIRTLDLNGYGIKSTGARVIAVEAGGNLTIMDSNTDNLSHKFRMTYPSSSNIVNAGLATLDEANGTIVIEGGYITGGNTPSYNNAYTKGGAGIRVCEGTLTLQGGTIIGNHSQSGWGGGVMVTKGGTFNMSGGAICYNRADWGSGLSMYGNNDLGAANKDGITCTVTEGSIHHNYANGGDAVHNVSNDYTVTYTMTGGSIRDNYANNSSFNRAGLHVDGIKFTCNISGNPVVINNYCSSKLRNATIEEGMITITGPLSEANIGVWKAQTGIFATNMEGNGDISQFVSDRSDYSVALHFTGDAKLAIASSFSTTPTAKSLTYNGSAQQLVNAGTSSHGTIEYKLGDGAWGTAIPTATEADTYTVYYHIIGDANHTDNPGSSISVTINPAPLTCTADDKEVTYGDAAPEYTVSYSGWLGSDNTSAISGSLAFACDYSAGSNVGDYIITPSGVTASNYDITFNTGTLTVNKASATITSAPTPVDDLSYDGEEHSLVSAGSVSAGTMKYSLDNSDWSEAIPTASAIGTHRVYYMLDGGQNYTTVSNSLYVETTIAGPRVADNADPSTTLTTLYTDAAPMSLLMNRTIYADGDYNTICLPFSVSESDFANPAHPLYGYERLKAFRGAQVTGSGQDLSIDVFVQDATEIVAGVPYLITYPSNHGDIVNPLFANITVTATEPGNVSANGVTFQGMFAPVHITSYEENTTQDYLFLGANNQLNWPTNDGSSMRGFRAYFIIDRQVITPSMAPRNSRARIVEHTDTATGMDSVSGNTSPETQKVLRDGQLIIISGERIYNAQGQLVK